MASSLRCSSCESVMMGEPHRVINRRDGGSSVQAVVLFGPAEPIGFGGG